MLKRLLFVVFLVSSLGGLTFLDLPTVSAQTLPDWCYEYDFTASDGGWIRQYSSWQDQAEYIPGVGWSSRALHPLFGYNLLDFQGYVEIGTAIVNPDLQQATYTNIEVTFDRTASSAVPGHTVRPLSEYWWEIWGMSGFASTEHVTIGGQTGVAPKGTDIVRSWVGERDIKRFIVQVVAAEGYYDNGATGDYQWYNLYQGTTVIKHIKIQGIGDSPEGSSNCTPAIPSEEPVIPEPGAGYDWCYTFNFLTNDHEVQALIGTHQVGTGYSSANANGVQALLLSYAQGVSVYPDLIQLRLNRGAFTGSLPINIQASFNAFGIGHTPDPIFFDITPEEEFKLISLTPEFAGPSGNGFTVSLTSSQQVDLAGLTVYGYGASPFPFNLCGEPTPTAVPTGTPSPSPTVTGIPSSTPNYTATPSDGWCYTTLDFNGGYFPFTWEIQSGTVSGGQLVQNGPFLSGAYRATTGVYIDLPSDVIIGAWGAQTAWERTGGGNDQGKAVYAQAWYRSGTQFMALTDVGDPGGYPTFEFRRYPTPSGSLSRSDIGRLFINTGGNSSAAVMSYMDDVHVRYQRTGGGCYESPTPTTTPGPTSTSTPTLTFTPSRTPTPTPFTLTPTATRTPTRTPIPIIVPTTAPTSTPRPPTATSAPTNTPNPSYTPPGAGTPVGTVGPFDPPGGGSGGVSDGLGNALTAFGANAWGRVRGWVGDGVGSITRLTNAWSSAVPTAPPTMPRCKSDPFANELCAIWYMLTFSVFAGTVGSLIMPIAVAAIDIYFLFVFFRMARAIIAQIKQIRSS